MSQLQAQPYDRYEFPIRPGQPNFLTGTMGELRSTHFHAGIDIKTGGRTGYEVRATSSGYISRINISGGGYGNALYLQHDDGNISVYGHLERFVEPLQQYMLVKQYEQRNFEIDVSPGENTFRFEKGELLGWSGNSGSSSGPHLHFEIRDAYHRPLNPLTFSFDEVRDNIPPRAVAVAFSVKSKQGHIEGDMAWNSISLRENGPDYTADTIDAYGSLGVELSSFDRLNGVTNRNGYPCVEMTFDGNLIYRHDIKRLDFTKSREIHLYTNNRNYRRYMRLYRPDGSTYDFIEHTINNGYINITDNSLHTLDIVLTDSYGNSRKIHLVLRGKPGAVEPLQSPVLHENYLFFAGSGDKAVVRVGNHQYPVKPVYILSDQNIFQWDMRLGLAHELISGGDTLHAGYNLMILPGEYGSFSGDGWQVKTYPNSAYDTTYLSVVNRDHKLIIQNPYGDGFTGRGSFMVSLRDTIQDMKYSLYDVSGRFPSFIGAKKENGWYSTLISQTTELAFLRDETSPEITFRRWSDGQVDIRIDDDLSGIKEYYATMNGRWILLGYDPKYKRLYRVDGDKNIPDKGEFILQVTDNANNSTVFKKIIP